MGQLDVCSLIGLVVGVIFLCVGIRNCICACKIKGTLDHYLLLASGLMFGLSGLIFTIISLCRLLTPGVTLR